MSEEVSLKYKKINPVIFKEKLSKIKLDKNSLKRETGTVITATSFIDDKGDMGVVSFSDTMESMANRSENYTCQKIGYLNPFVAFSETGAVLILELIEKVTNEMSRYMMASRQFDYGLNNPESCPKLEEISDFMAKGLQYFPDTCEFIVFGQDNQGELDLCKIIADGNIDHLNSFYGRQNLGDIKHSPIKFTTSGSGRISARPTMNLFLALTPNLYELIEQDSVNQKTAELLNILSCRSAFNSVPGASAYVGGHIVGTVFKKGNALSPDISLTMYDGRKVSDLKQLLPFLSIKVNKGYLETEIQDAVNIDEKKLEDLLAKKLDSSIAKHAGAEHESLISKTPISVGGFNDKLIISQWKKPEDTQLNKETTDDEISKVKEIKNKIKQGMKEIYKKEIYSFPDLPPTGLTAQFSRLDEALSKHNNMIIAYKANSELDKDEEKHFGKKSIPGVVVLRYLSPDEKPWKENVGILELEDNKRIGWSGIATHGGIGFSRNLEKLLYESILYSAEELGEPIELNSLLNFAYTALIKGIFKTDFAMINESYGVEGFGGLGIEVNQKGSAKIVKMLPTGLDDTGDCKSIGPLKNYKIPEEIVKLLPEDAFEPEICYYTGILSLLEALCYEPGEKQKTPKQFEKLKLEKLNEMKDGRLEIVHISPKASYNSKLSGKKINYILDAIISNNLY